MGHRVQSRGVQLERNRPQYLLGLSLCLALTLGPVAHHEYPQLQFRLGAAQRHGIPFWRLEPCRVLEVFQGRAEASAQLDGEPGYSSSCWGHGVLSVSIRPHIADESGTEGRIGVSC